MQYFVLSDIGEDTISCANILNHGRNYFNDLIFKPFNQK